MAAGMLAMPFAAVIVMSPTAGAVPRPNCNGMPLQEAQRCLIEGEQLLPQEYPDGHPNCTPSAFIPASMDSCKKCSDLPANQVPDGRPPDQQPAKQPCDHS